MEGWTPDESGCGSRRAIGMCGDGAFGAREDCGVNTADRIHGCSNGRIAADLIHGCSNGRIAADLIHGCSNGRRAAYEATAVAG